jgi:hypothetical protein
MRDPAGALAGFTLIPISGADQPRVLTAVALIHPPAGAQRDLLAQQGGDNHFHEQVCQDTDGQQQHPHDVKRVQLVAPLFILVVKNVLPAFDTYQLARGQLHGVSALADHVSGWEGHKFTLILK